MLLIDLGCIEYSKALEIQRRIVENKISKGGPEVLLVLEHPPTVTIGTRGDESDLLVSVDTLGRRGIGLFRVDRGGEATYHGPGQLVFYPIVDLRRLRLSVRDYVLSLEETIIRCLAMFGLESFRQPGKVGVWTGPLDKIASIGVRIQRRITSHGFSVNVDVRMDPCELIVSCGMPDVRMVSLNEFVDPPVGVKEFRGAMVAAFSEVFAVSIKPSSLEKAVK
jgi:lipoate-protein ligase B